MGTSQTSRRSIAASLLVAGAALALVLRAALSGDFVYSTWTDRDLVRGTLLRDAAGPELSFGDGARIPGATTTLVFGLPQLLGGGAATVHRSVMALLGVALVALYASVARRHGHRAAALAALWLASSDTLWQVQAGLWNPSWVVPFVALAALGVDRVVVARRADGLLWTAWWLTLAAQVHLTGALLAVATALWLAPCGVPRRGRAALAAVGLVLLLHAPYLVEEALGGWPNARLMRTQPALVDDAPEVDRSALGGALAMLAGELPPRLRRLGVPEVAWSSAFVVPPLAALATLAWVTVAVVRRRAGDAERSLAVLGGATGSALLAFAWIPAEQLHARYVVFALPAMAVLAGVGLDRLVLVAWRRHRALGVTALGGVGLVASAWLARGVLESEPPSGPHAHRRLMTAIDAARAATGWTLAEFVGRTLVLDPTSPAARHGWTLHPTVRHLLLAEGLEPPGSAAPPCALLVDHVHTRWWPGAKGADVAWVDDVLGQDPGARQVLGVDDLGAGFTLLTYDRDDPLCPASMSQRYVPSAVEAAVEASIAARGCPEGPVEIAPVRPGTRLFAAILPSGGFTCGGYPVGIETEADGERCTATVHANALRGRTANGGRFTPGLLRRPTLHWQDGADVGSGLLTQGWLGHPGAITPVRRDDLRAGARISLTAEAVPLRGELPVLEEAEAIRLDLPPSACTPR